MGEAPGGKLFLCGRGMIDRPCDGLSQILAHTFLQRSNRDAWFFPGGFIELTTCFG
jgi:hypothetical protein